jgi:hypothetical protein
MSCIKAVATSKYVDSIVSCGLRWIDDLIIVLHFTLAAEMESLRELDVRAAKKQVCKVAQDVAEILIARKCMLRGGVIKKSKKPKKGKPTIGF